MAKKPEAVRVLYAGPSASLTVDGVEIPRGVETEVPADVVGRLLALEGHDVAVVRYGDAETGAVAPGGEGAGIATEAPAVGVDDVPAEDATVAGSAPDNGDLAEGDETTPE